MPRTPRSSTSLLILAVGLIPSSALADWEEDNFDVVAAGAPNTSLEPSLAAGIDHPTEKECALEPCALEEPVPVTKVAFVDTGEGGNLTLASRFGPPGEPWSVDTIWEGPTRHPQLILDNDGGEIFTFLDTNSNYNRLMIARRTHPNEGNCGPDDAFYCRRVSGGSIEMPAPVVMQYHAAYAGAPVGGERRLHVVFSRDGALYHAFIDEARFWDGKPFEEYPIGATQDFLSGEIEFEPDAVSGTWPAATPAFATDFTAEPFNWEEFPAVAYDDGGVAFRRAWEGNWSTKPMLGWIDRVLLRGDYDQRPTIDTRGDAPVVAWAPACSDGGAGLHDREAKEAEPWSIYDWLPTTTYVSENACDPSLSVGKYGAPYIAYVEPGMGTIELRVRPLEGKPWAAPTTIDDGAEPSMDYNTLTARQSLAYTEPSSGELRVVDGFWY